MSDSTPGEYYEGMDDEELLETWEELQENEPSGNDPRSNRGAWIAAMNTIGTELSNRGILPPHHSDHLRGTGFYDLLKGLDRGERREVLDAVRQGVEAYGEAMYRRGLRVGEDKEVRKRDELPEVIE